MTWNTLPDRRCAQHRNEIPHIVVQLVREPPVRDINAPTTSTSRCSTQPCGLPETALVGAGVRQWRKPLAPSKARRKPGGAQVVMTGRRSCNNAIQLWNEPVASDGKDAAMWVQLLRTVVKQTDSSKATGHFNKSDCADASVRTMK